MVALIRSLRRSCGQSLKNNNNEENETLLAEKTYLFRSILYPWITKLGAMMLVPLFPLEIVVFPFEKLNLHIFEPRYRQLIEDSQKEEIHFGIPYYVKGQALKYGTLVKLEEISKKNPDGSMDIKTVGLRPFEINRYVKFHPGKLYPGGYITELYWEKEGIPELTIEIREQLRILYQYMKIAKWPAELDTDFITYDIAHKVGLSRAQEYDLLRTVREDERQEYILRHLKKMIPVVREAEEMKKKVQMNGHFKNLNPPLV